MPSIFAVPVPIQISPAGLLLPLARDTVQAGFPSPAEDFTVKRIDLTAELIVHPQGPSCCV